MSDFFDSEIVQKEIDLIGALQKRVYQSTMNYFAYDYEEKKHHIQLVKDLIDKQKILHTRLSLSDDPDAKELIEKMLKASAKLGMPSHTNMREIFDHLESEILKLEELLDKEQ